MKRVFLLMMLLVLLIPAQALAADTGRDIVLFGNSAVIEADETVGDVIVFGGSATIHGTATGDVLVFGGGASITGSVYGNVIAFGGGPRLESGEVKSDIVGFGGGATVDSLVGGNIISFGGSTSLLANAVVNGDIFTVGGSLNRSAGAVVNGSVNSPLNMNLSWTGSSLPGLTFFGFSLFRIWSLLVVVLLGWLIYARLPKHVTQVANTMTLDPAKAVIFGFIGYLAIVPLMLLMVVTIVGIPLVPVLLMAVAVGRLLGQIALGLVAGHWLAARLNLETASVAVVLFGLTTLGMLSLVPGIGFALSLFYGLVGFGAVLRSRFGTKSLSA